jgi:lipoprotein-releasing system permease protein
MPFELYVALRYLTARRKQTLVSVVSLIAVAGVTVGVMALIIALALMTGFSSDIQGKILGAEAHVFVYGDKLTGGIHGWEEVAKGGLAVEHVLGAAPNVLDTGILEGTIERDRASLRGIVPEREAAVTALASVIRDGRLEDLAPDAAGRRPGIILGKDLANELGIGVGDVVRYLSLSQATLSPLGPLPRRQTFAVVGLFETGLYEYDRSWALIHLTTAQRLLDLDDAVTTVKLKVDRLDHIPAVTEAVKRLFGSRYLVRDLMTLNRPLFSAFKLEKLLMFITISLIVVVAALNIVTTLTMMVMEKNKDIGILMTMGTTAPTVTRIFMLQGLVIGVLGMLLGVGLGTATCWVLDTYRLIELPTSVYYIPYLPFKMNPLDIAVIAVTAVLISFLATLYPAYRAARLDPVQALRYE